MPVGRVVSIVETGLVDNIDAWANPTASASKPNTEIINNLLILFLYYT